MIGFYFYHLYFCIQNNCCSKNYQLLLVCNNLTVFDLFFMLKKVPNISHYFVFNYFIFFFLSRKISDIFNYSVMYFFTKSKSISYIFFLSFSSLKVFYTPWKSVWKYNHKDNSCNFKQYLDFCFDFYLFIFPFVIKIQCDFTECE